MRAMHLTIDITVGHAKGVFDETWVQLDFILGDSKTNVANVWLDSTTETQKYVRKKTQTLETILG